MTYQQRMICSIKSNGKFIKEDRSFKEPVVWLPFGSEYSLYFKNLHSRNAVVKVSIDGQDVLDGAQLIVKPNQPFDLERFISNRNLNKGNRFKFIEKTDQISEHRGDRPEDGLIVVKFQFEAAPTLWTNTIFRSPSYNYGYENTVYGSCSDNAVYSANVGSSINCCAQTLSSNTDGITAKGTISEQKFTNGSVGFLETEEHTIVLQLRGKNGNLKESPKFIHPKPRLKSSCDNCGTIYRGWPQFCSNCGSAINAEI